MSVNRYDSTTGVLTKVAGNGGSSDNSWTGTQAEWEALSSTEKAKYEVLYFTDDVDDGNGGTSGISSLIDDTTSATDKTYSSNKIATDFPFKLGIDADGNYGYYKVGADSVTPFKSDGTGDIGTLTPLWTNPDTSTMSSFKAQTLTLDLSGYSLIAIKYLMYLGESEVAYFISEKDYGTTKKALGCMLKKISGDIYKCCRYFKIYDDRIVFENCLYEGGGGSSAAAVPLVIYGIENNFFE